MKHEIPYDVLSNWNVVVVDDDPTSREIIATLLTDYGAKVYEAAHGQEGLEVIRTVKPHFVISDIAMPVMSGWDMIDAMNKDRGLAAIPVIALTAHSQHDRNRAIAAGFQNYLSKPLTPSTFINDLLRLLVDIPRFADELARS